MERKAGTTQSLEAICKRFEGKPGALLGILEEAQATNEHKYLSEATMRFVAERTGTPLSAVYSVATFYSYFNLKPQGKHTIVVCRGTACHTRGSIQLLEEAAIRLGAEGFREDEEASFTTPDKRFTVRTVACFGQCALAPVVAIDEVIYSHMTVNKLVGIIEKAGKAVDK